VPEKYFNDLLACDTLKIVQLSKKHHELDSIICKQKSDSCYERDLFDLGSLKSFYNHPEQKQDTIAFSQSAFVHHKLQAKQLQPQESSYSPNVFPAIILFCLLLVLSIIRQANVKRFNDIIKAFFIPRIAVQIAREENSIINRTSISLLVVFVFSGGLFLYQLANFLGFYPVLVFGTGSYFIFCAGIFALYFIKITSLKVLAYVFRTEHMFSEYSFFIVLFNQILGLALIPLSAAITFARVVNAEYIIYAGLALILGMLFFRILRGSIAVVSRQNVSRFYLFLYLCTLEILPMALLVKAFLLIFN